MEVVGAGDGRFRLSPRLASPVRQREALFQHRLGGLAEDGLLFVVEVPHPEFVEGHKLPAGGFLVGEQAVLQGWCHGDAEILVREGRRVRPRRHAERPLVRDRVHEQAADVPVPALVDEPRGIAELGLRPTV